MHLGAAVAPCRVSYSFQQQYPLLGRQRDQRENIVSKSQEILAGNRKTHTRDCTSRLHPRNDRRLDALGIEAGINPSPREVKIVKPGGVGRQSPLRRAGGRNGRTSRWIALSPT